MTAFLYVFHSSVKLFIIFKMIASNTSHTPRQLPGSRRYLSYRRCPSFQNEKTAAAEVTASMSCNKSMTQNENLQVLIFLPGLLIYVCVTLFQVNTSVSSQGKRSLDLCVWKLGEKAFDEKLLFGHVPASTPAAGRTYFESLKICKLRPGLNLQLVQHISI